MMFEIESFLIFYLVDDDDVFCDLFVVFCDLVGFDVEEFWLVKEFFDGLFEEMNGCVFFDVCMLGMSGVEFFLELKEWQFSFLVIFLIGYGDVLMVVVVMKDGVFDFMMKFFSY